MSNLKNNLSRAIQLCSILLFISLITASVEAQTPSAANDNRDDPTRARALMPRFRLPLVPVGFKLMSSTNSRTNDASRSGAMPMAAGSTLQVMGGGILGRVTKWTGFTSSNSFIGDTTIFEDKFGKVGIGTDTPTSRLTVTGMIETTLGGLKFPDGTVQTTAGLASIFHDATLAGNGTSNSPLGVAIPLNLIRSVPGDSILTVVNTGNFGAGVNVSGGGDESSFTGGTGVRVHGGNALFGGGSGMEATGGNALFTGTGTPSTGGIGIEGTGGNSSTNAGTGVVARGGFSPGGRSGTGVDAAGGNSNGFGGDGLFVVGGAGIGANSIGGNAVFAVAGSGPNAASAGAAGFFTGKVQIIGDLNVTGTKNFKIDHPLDPENKYLYHAAIESSEVLNIYSGNVTTNEKGEATVALPDWFEALNKDFRYQLTSIGAPAQGLYIAEKITKNRFKLAGGQPGLEVSWQVTGVRSDAVMLGHPFKPEGDKSERERGFYLSPEAYHQPDERSVEWARNPEMMQRIKEMREKARKANQN